MPDSNGKHKSREAAIIALVREIKKDWDQAKIDELVSMYRPFLGKLKWKLASRAGVSHTEAEQELYSQFLQLVHDFDPDYRSGVNVANFTGVYFTRWVRVNLYGRTELFLSKCRERKPSVSYGDYFGLPGDPEAKPVYDNFEFVRERLGEEYVRIFDLYFKHGYSQQEIGRILNMHQNSVSIMLIKIKNEFRDFYLSHNPNLLDVDTVTYSTFNRRVTDAPDEIHEIILLNMSGTRLEIAGSLVSSGI